MEEIEEEEEEERRGKTDMDEAALYASHESS